MGERKVLNECYPLDFDPANIRIMLPMSIICNTCGTYIYEGTYFNSRKEDVIGETYLGIQIFRFYFKCTNCVAEITMKTDLQNSDYVIESGAARNFEPCRTEEEATEREERKTEEMGQVTEREKRKIKMEKMSDAMKSLENRAMDSKQDGDILADHVEMMLMMPRHATVSVDDLLAALKHSSYGKEKRIVDEIDKADEEVFKSIISPGAKDYVRRIEDDDEDDDEDEDVEVDLPQPSSSLSQSSENNSEGKSTSGLPSVVGKLTDTLTKASIFNSSENGETLGGSSVYKPKFSLKPCCATDGPPNKKLVTEIYNRWST